MELQQKTISAVVEARNLILYLKESYDRRGLEREVWPGGEIPMKARACNFIPFP
jgi:hypothetical protein